MARHRSEKGEETCWQCDNCLLLCLAYCETYPSSIVIKTIFQAQQKYRKTSFFKIFPIQVFKQIWFSKSKLFFKIIRGIDLQKAAQIAMNNVSAFFLFEFDLLLLSKWKEHQTENRPVLVLILLFMRNAWGLAFTIICRWQTQVFSLHTRDFTSSLWLLFILLFENGWWGLVMDRSRWMWWCAVSGC